MSKQIGCKKYTQESLQIAVDAVRGKTLSLRAAARTYNIPRGTLFDKLTNRRPFEAAPKTVLTPEEEERLVQWILHMARIGFGRTRPEVMDTVKRILDLDGRPNPFKNNKPGKDWWYGFVKRHPEISERMPQQLGKERAIITPAKVDQWFADYEKYILEEVKDPTLLLEPSRLYNADESGFTLCPKSGKVLARKGSANVYNFTSSDKTQITVLACMGATGHYLKPLIVYPGQRFSYNPLEGFPEAMMGRSDNGWMDSDLFCTWLTELFIPEVNNRGVKKPVVLFVDGHSTHMSTRVSEICRENGIEVYCLLEHASHLMQLCDLRLFGNLKVAWRQAVREFQYENIGDHVTKKTFAQVFKKAWDQSTTVTVAVNGFRDAGLFPLDPRKITATAKMGPSDIFHFREGGSACPPATANTSDRQCTTTSDTVPHMPVETVATTLPEQPATSSEETQPRRCGVTCTTGTSTSSQDVLAEVLKLPSAVNTTKKQQTRREALPKAITGMKFTEMMEERQKEKEQAEKEKQERKQQREIKKAQREEEKQQRQRIREEKKKEKEERKKIKVMEKRLKEIEKQELRKRKHSDTSSDESTDMPNLTDGSDSDTNDEEGGNSCGICGAQFDNSPFWLLQMHPYIPQNLRKND